MMNGISPHGAKAHQQVGRAEQAHPIRPRLPRNCQGLLDHDERRSLPPPVPGLRHSAWQAVQLPEATYFLFDSGKTGFGFHPSMADLAGLPTK
jgi:hypothetical protein